MKPAITVTIAANGWIVDNWCSTNVYTDPVEFLKAVAEHTLTGADNERMVITTSIKRNAD